MNFIWLFELFKLYPREAAHARFRQLENRIDQLYEENESLRRELHVSQIELRGKEEKEKKLHRLISVSLGDPAPTDEKQRAEYMARVSQVAEILKPKVMHIIAQTREELDTLFTRIPEGWTREQYDNFLRGTSNFGKLFLDWIELAESEHSAYINQEPND